MTFIWPAALIGLAAVPLALILYLAVQRRRMRYAVRFTNLDLLATVAPRRPRWRRHLPVALYLVALLALILAVSRPEATFSTPVKRSTIVLVMDTSRSMAATDVAPDRLAAAKAAANTFLDTVPSEARVGVVSFSTSVRVLTPPTDDRVADRAAIASLAPDRGTAMGEAIAAALESGRAATAQGADGSGGGERPEGEGRSSPEGSSGESPFVILLLSDGASTVGEDPMVAAEEARKEGVRIYTVALGTDEGRVETPDGQIVPVPPDRETLGEVAGATGGRFFEAPDAADLKSVYKDLGSQLGEKREKREITVAFAAAGLGFMLVGAGLSVVWFNRFP